MYSVPRIYAAETDPAIYCIPEFHNLRSYLNLIIAACLHALSLLLKSHSYILHHYYKIIYKKSNKKSNIQSLSFNKLSKISVFLNQLVIIALFDDLPAIQHEDTVTVFDRAEPVGDNNPGAIQPVQRL